MGQIPRTRDDIRLHGHTGIYDGGRLDSRSFSGISITSLAGGANVALLDADQTFTGQNTFNGPTIFNGDVSIATLSVSGSLTVPDSAFRITGSADPTKLLAFEVDGFTAATTRTLTPQNASYTIPGLELDQSWTGDNTFTATTDALTPAIKIIPYDVTTYPLIIRDNLDSVDNLKAITNTGGGGWIFRIGAITADIEPDPSSFGGGTYKLALRIGSPGYSMSWDEGALWNDSRGTSLFELSNATDKSGSFTGRANTAMARLSMSSARSLLVNSGISGATVPPVAMWEVRNAATAGDVLLQLSAHGSQSADIMRVLDSAAAQVFTLTSTGALSVTLAPKIDIASAATGSLWTATDADGNGVWATAASVIDIARTWTTLQTFPDNTFKVVGSADASKTLLFELDGATANADARILWTGAVDADFTLPPTTTTLAGLAIVQEFTAAQTIHPATDVVALTINQNDVDTIAEDILQVNVQGGAPKVLSVDGDGNTNMAGIIFYPSGGVGSGSPIVMSATALTGTRSAYFQDASGKIPAMSIVTSPPGLAGSLGGMDRTTQTANIATTNLTNTAVVGLYLVEAVLMTTTGAGAGGTLALTVGWTDNAGAATANIIAAHSLVAAGRSTGYQLLRVNSGEITCAVTVTGIYSTSVYAVYVRATYMGHGTG